MRFGKPDADPYAMFKPGGETVEFGSSRPPLSRRMLVFAGCLATVAFIAGAVTDHRLNDGAPSSPEPRADHDRNRIFAADVFITPTIWARPAGQISGPVVVECGIYDYNAYPDEDEKPAFRPDWYQVYNYNAGEKTGFVRAEHVSLYEVAPACHVPAVAWIQLEHDIPGIDRAETAVLGNIVPWNDRTRQVS
jgi:hypothetical protein